MKRALITGISGQDGLYLSELLLSKGYQVYGVIRDAQGSKAEHVRATVPEVVLLTGDITDTASVAQALSTSEPDEVYNLAALSHVALSWQHAQLTTDVTGKGVLNVLEAIRHSSREDPRRVRFYQASSSEMFGNAQAVPQTESTLPWPRSPYGVAKVFGHYITINYRESHGLFACSGILFNHESPRRSPDFVTRKVTRAVARISRGLQARVVLGDLDARRDWGFAGDYVEAMWLMLQQDEPDDYVVATGQTHAIRDLLDIAFNAVGIGDWHRFVVQDNSLYRPAEVKLLVGDATKAREKLGWIPRISFPELVAMMVDEDLRQLSRSA